MGSAAGGLPDQRGRRIVGRYGAGNELHMTRIEE